MALVTGITLPNNGDRIKAENYNDPITKILAQVNGNLDDSNISGINGSKIAAGSIPASALSTAYLNQLAGGWTDLAATPTSVVYNGNSSYTATFAADQSSKITPGTRIRTTRSTPAPTQSTTLNGTNQYWNNTSPNKMTFIDDFVVSAWVKVTSYTTGDSGIVSRLSASSGWWFGINPQGQVLLSGHNAALSNFTRVVSRQSLPLNKWVHITAQLDMSAATATTSTSYVMFDGMDIPATIVQSGTNPTTLVQAGNLEVGSYLAGQFFPGKIAQAAVFNSKLTQATVRSMISQGLTGTELSLVSAWSFSGSVTDLMTTTPNNLTPQNAVTATTNDSPFGGMADGTSSSTLDFGIVQATTPTTVTWQVPEGSRTPTNGISAMAFSAAKVPYGFPSDVDKWTLQTISRVRTTNGSSVNGAIANPGQWSLDVPIGKFIMSLDAPAYANRGSSGAVDIRGWFGTVTASLTGKYEPSVFNTYTQAASDGGTWMHKEFAYTANSTTRLFLNIQNSTGVNIADMGWLNDFSMGQILARNAYL